MANLFAQLENSIPADADAEPEVEAPEGEESETEESETEESETEESETEESETEESEPEEESVKPLKLPDNAKVMVDGKALTLKELKDGALRQADYTRKTQELSAQRKQLTAEVSALKEENEEFRDWLGSLKDAPTLRLELLRYFPETYDALREAIVAERLEEQDLSESERKTRRRLERADAAEYARKKEDEYKAKKSEAQETAQRTAQLRETFDGWLQATMTDSGLDPANQDHADLVKNEIASRFKGVKWDKSHFEQACARIGKTLGVSKTPKPATPPVRAQGNKAPAKKPATTKPKAATNDYFAELRRKYGTR